MTWLDIALWIAFGLIATGTLLIGAWILAFIIAAGVRSVRHDPYPGQAAEAPDPVDAHADTVPVERAQPWTGDNITVSPAIWVPDSQLIRDIYTAIDAYRHGQDPGGTPELSPLTRWTERGWRPIADWRLARTDKRWR